MQSATSDQKTFPYAEWAPTAARAACSAASPSTRTRCASAVEREVEMGGVARAGAGYLHPNAAGEFVKDEKLAEQLKQNSSGLKPEELDLVLQKL